MAVFMSRSPNVSKIRTQRKSVPADPRIAAHVSGRDPVKKDVGGIRDLAGTR